MNTQTSYTQDEILRLAQKPKLKTGTKDRPATYRFIVDSEDVKVNEFEGAEQGCYQLTLRVLPLRNPEDGGSRDFNLGQWARVTLPLANPNIPDHKVPQDTADKAIQTLSAIRPDLIAAFPRMVDGQMRFKGEVIEKTQEMAGRAEAVKALMEVSQALVEKHINKTTTEAPSFEDYAFYADAILTKKGNVFLVGYRNELRPGQERNLVAATQFRSTD